MSFQTFMFPSHFSRAVVLAATVTAGGFIWDASRNLLNNPDHAHRQFWGGGMAALLAHMARRKYVLEDQNAHLENELIKARLELMARELAASFAQGAHPPSSMADMIVRMADGAVVIIRGDDDGEPGGGEVIDGQTRVIPDSAPGNTLK